MKAICFGAGDGGIRLYEKICHKYEVVAFADNDNRKWGELCCEKNIFSPEYCLKHLQYDHVIITSAAGLENIKKQCISMGVEENRIVTSYVELPVESRIEFLKCFAEIYSDKTQGSVAEAGVFEGDFAKEINRYFPERKLHLFDTFSGFDKRDIQKEGEMSNAIEGELKNTSVESVISKMPFPEKCIVHKGYFPETAIGNQVEKETFCFVNLDMDLYEPTYQGLMFFGKRMEHNGVIVIHDYFTDHFKGPRQAISRFMEESGQNLQMLPIGDGISVAICGF